MQKENYEWYHFKQIYMFLAGGACASISYCASIRTYFVSFIAQSHLEYKTALVRTNGWSKTGWTTVSTDFSLISFQFDY